MTQDAPNEDQEDDGVTTSTKERWTYIGTLLAGAMVLSLPIITIAAASGMLTITVLGEAWFGLYATVTLMAAVWAFGKETLETVQKARGK